MALPTPPPLDDPAELAPNPAPAMDPPLPLLLTFVVLLLLLLSPCCHFPPDASV